MAATGTRPAAAARFGAAAAPEGALLATEREPLAPWLLGLALAASIAYAAFARGAIGLEDESNLQIGIAAIALPSLAAVLFGYLRADAERGAALGLGLLAGFVVWCALSITWSIAPDQSWVQANRALAYLLVAALGLAFGSSMPRAAERAALGYLALALVVSLYALGGKVAPWFHIGGLIDLNQTAEFTRLRAPIDYANALALFCAMAVPVALRMAVDDRRSDRARLGGLIALIPLVCTIVLTYSRGGLLATVVAIGVLVAFGPERARILAFAAAGVAACVPALVVALARKDLTTANLSVHERTDAGALVALGLLIGIGFAVLAARVLIRNDERLAFPPHLARLVPRVTLALVAAVAVIGITVTVANDKAGGGSVGNSFTRSAEDKPNDPARLLQTNSTNRAGWWKEAVGAWSDEPIFGHGAGSFPALHLLYRDNGLQVKQPHSVPLEFLSETGLIGALLVLGGLGLLGLAGLRRVMAMSDGRERAFVAALLAGCTAWGVQMIVDWDWDIPAVTLPLLALLGVAAARPPDRARSLEHAEYAETAGLRIGALAVGGAVVCLFAISALLPALSERWTDDALNKLDNGTPGSIQAAGRQADKAMQIDPFSITPVLAAAQIADRAGDNRRVRDLYLKAVDRQPDSSLAWARLAQFQLTLDDSPGALRSIRIAQELDPRSAVPGFIALAALYDDTRSASATGTPLPLVLQPPTLKLPTPPAPVPGTAPPAAVAPGQPPAAPRVPTPAPAPKAAPTPAPKPLQQFRLEG